MYKVTAKVVEHKTVPWQTSKKPVGWSNTFKYNQSNERLKIVKAVTQWERV